MKNTSDKFLPIGSVVILKDATKRLMITGFCAKQENNPEKLWDYIGCLYPEGVLVSTETALFDHEQIETVFYYGLIDEEERQFKEDLNKYLANENNDIKIE